MGRGVSFVITHHDIARQVAFVLGVCGLVGSSAMLVWETRLTLAMLAEATDLVIAGLHLGADDKTTECV